MLIVFNKSGSEFSVDFQYDSFSQGDSNTHIVDVIVEDTTFSNYEYNGYVQFLREGEKEPSPKLIMATKRMEYNGNYYSGYTFKMESDWFAAIAGTLKMTIEIKKYSNGSLQSNKAYGVVNIPVQDSVSSQADVDSAITDEEYTAMVQLINSKLNVDDYDIEKSWYDVEEDFADDCIGQVKNNTTKRKIFFTSIGDEPTRYEAIGLVNQQNGTYYCVVYSPTGTSLFKKTASDDYVTKIKYKTSATIFETNDGTAPVHLKSSFPYIVSDTAGKVGMRAYTEDGEYQGEIAGQFAVSKDDTNENGHFANLQARDNVGNLHTLRVSGKGVSYFKNSERHQIPLDENVVHNTSEETIGGSKTFERPISLKESRNVSGKTQTQIVVKNSSLNNVGEIRFYKENSNQRNVVIVAQNDNAENITFKQLIIDDDGVGYSNDYTNQRLATKSDVEQAKTYTDNAIANLIDNAPATLDTFKEVATYIASDKTFASQITANVNQNRERITALDNTKANRNELFSKNYDELINAPEKLDIVVRDTISADTYNEAREIQIGRDKFKFGSGSKIKANEFVDGTLPTLEYLNIDGKTYQLPNYVVNKSGLKLVAEGSLEMSDINQNYYKPIYNFEKGKLYIILISSSFSSIAFCQKNGEISTDYMYRNGDDSGAFFIQNSRYLYTITYDGEIILEEFLEMPYEVYEIPIGESAQVEKHNKTINALMQRVSDLEQKAGLTSVGYVQDNTLNLIRVNVVDDVLEVSGFKFDGEVMII